MISLTILGEHGVGKTWICRSFLGISLYGNICGRFDDQFYSDMTMSDGKKVHIKIWDTLGREPLKSIASKKLRNSKGVIFVYEVIYKRSFEKLGYWLEQIRVYSQDMPVV